MRKAEEIAKTKDKILQARHDVPEDVPVGVPAGMTVQELDDEEMTNELEAVLPAKKIPERKTKQERRKAEKRLAEVRPKSLCILGSLDLKIRHHPAETRSCRESRSETVPRIRACSKVTQKNAQQRHGRTRTPSPGASPTASARTAQKGTCGTTPR